MVNIKGKKALGVLVSSGGSVTLLKEDEVADDSWQTVFES